MKIFNQNTSNFNFQIFQFSFTCSMNTISKIIDSNQYILVTELLRILFTVHSFMEKEQFLNDIFSEKYLDKIPLYK